MILPYLELDFQWWTIPLAVGGLLPIFYQFVKESKDPGAAYKKRWPLPALQVLALFILVAQLNAPVLVRSHQAFYPPYVVVALDESGSFQSGNTLGLKEAVSAAKDSVIRHYKLRGFKALELVFDEEVGSTTPSAGDSLKFSRLTNFSRLSAYLRDSLGPQPPQAIFLFSDGRGNFSPDGRGVAVDNEYPAPVYPFVFSMGKQTDIQLDTAFLLPGTTEGDAREVVVRWRSFGGIPLRPKIEFYQSTKKLWERPLVYDSSKLVQEEIVPWKNIPPSPLAIRCQVAGEGKENNHFNNTVSLDPGYNKKRPTVIFEKEVSSLNGKWMAAVLRESGYRVIHKARRQWAEEEFSEDDQIWIQAGSLRFATVRDLLKNTPASVLIYGAGKSSLAELWPDRRREWFRFGPNSEVFINSSARDHFKGVAGTYGGLSQKAVEAPGEAPETVVLGIRGKSRSGCLVCAGASPSQYALFYDSPFWKTLFNPQEPIEIKERIKSLIQGTAEFIRAHAQKINLTLPETLYERVPFAFSARVKSKASGLRLVFVSFNNKTFVELTQKSSGDHSLIQSSSIQLHRGRYEMRLEDGTRSLWKDSITVHSREEWEMGKTGFASDLEAVAQKTKGRVLRWGTSEGSPGLPEVSQGQTGEIQTKRTPLYNNWATFLSVLLFLSIVWILRKRKGLD